MYDGESRGTGKGVQGSALLAGGVVYIGHQQDDEATGALLFGNGDFYYGQVFRGVCDGIGIMNAGGRVFKGVWSKGAYVGGIPDGVALPDDLKSINSRAFTDMLGHMSLRAGLTPAKGAGDEGSGTPDRLGATLLVACGPAFVERFTLKKCLAHFCMFLVPILAIPHISKCYYGKTTIAQEREYVVSGAAIRKPPAPPKASIYVILVALMCAVAGLVVGIVYFDDFKAVTYIDVAAPFVGWVVFAGLLSGYHSLGRTPHPMERLDRNLIPRLASFCASNIDSYSPVCVYTWDVEGRTLVPNSHYMYRWVLYSAPIAAIVALAAPFARLANEHYMFGDSPQEKATAGLMFISLFLFSYCITYLCFKVTDIQRQVLGQLRVLSSLAYVGGASVLRPTTLRNVYFNFDEEVDLRSYDSGFTGWCMARSFLIYCSVCSNHRARGAVLTFLTIFVGAVAITGIVDALVSQRFDYCIYDSGHAIGLVVMILFSAITMRLQYLAVSTCREQRRHLYLIDLACNLSQTLRHRHASDYAACRDMVRRYDTRPELLFTEMRSWMMFGFFLLCCGGYASFLYAVIQAPRC